MYFFSGRTLSDQFNIQRLFGEFQNKSCVVDFWNKHNLCIIVAHELQGDLWCYDTSFLDDLLLCTCFFFSIWCRLLEPSLLWLRTKKRVLPQCMNLSCSSEWCACFVCYLFLISFYVFCLSIHVGIRSFATDFFNQFSLLLFVSFCVAGKFWWYPKSFPELYTIVFAHI